MGSGEKKVAALLTVALVVLIGVYFATKPKSVIPPMSPQGQMAGAPQQPGPGGPGGAAGPGGASCSTSSKGGGAFAKTQEFGKAGAKLEIVAVMPIAHGCHATTEAELKKAYEKHKGDIHLTIVDSAGPDAPKYQAKTGVGWTAVAINGKRGFSLGGRQVVFEKMEGGSFSPADVGPVIEEQLSGKKG